MGLFQAIPVRTTFEMSYISWVSAQYHMEYWRPTWTQIYRPANTRTVAQVSQSGKKINNLIQQRD